MRIWHYKLIPFISKEQLVDQWRSIIALKRSWDSNKLNNRMVDYIKNYSKNYFYNYFLFLIDELNARKINYNKKFIDEIQDFCKVNYENPKAELIYPEHNDRYLKQCIYILQEKYDRKIYSREAYMELQDAFDEFF